MGARGRPYLHVTVSDTLRTRITDRQLQPGALLPSEHDLAEEFGVSRSVVRQALRTLADEGYIAVVPGRGAVVAAQPEWHRNALTTAGLSAQMRAYGARVRTRVLTYRTQAAGEQSQALRCDDVLFLERLRLLDGEPVAYIRTWLPAWVAGVVRREHLADASLHEQLHRRAGVTVKGGPRQIRAVPVAPTMADQLGIPAGAPVLLLEGLSHDAGGSPVEVFSTWHRSDRIALDITVLDASLQDHPGAPPEVAQQLEHAALDLLRQVRKLAPPGAG